MSQAVHDHVAEAEREGWPGDVEGLRISLVGANDKFAQLAHERPAARRSTSACPAWSLLSPSRQSRDGCPDTISE